MLSLQGQKWNFHITPHRQLLTEKIRQDLQYQQDNSFHWFPEGTSEKPNKSAKPVKLVKPTKLTHLIRPRYRHQGEKEKFPTQDMCSTIERQPDVHNMETPSLSIMQKRHPAVLSFTSAVPLKWLRQKLLIRLLELDYALQIPAKEILIE